MTADLFCHAPKLHRVRLSRRHGWRMPPNTTKVDRTTWLGNPYRVDEHGTRVECVAMFRALLMGEREPDNASQEHRRDHIRYMLRSGVLKGRNLACWCPLDEPCHADVLLELANEASAA
jgi:hypothetical protein